MERALITSDKTRYDANFSYIKKKSRNCRAPFNLNDSRIRSLCSLLEEHPRVSVKEAFKATSRMLASDEFKIDCRSRLNRKVTRLKDAVEIVWTERITQIPHLIQQQHKVIATATAAEISNAVTMIPEFGSWFMIPESGSWLSLDELIADPDTYHFCADRCDQMNSRGTIKNHSRYTERALRDKIVRVFFTKTRIDLIDEAFLIGADEIIPKMRKEDLFYFWWIILGVLAKAQKITWKTRLIFSPEMRLAMIKGSYDAAKTRFYWAEKTEKLLKRKPKNQWQLPGESDMQCTEETGPKVPLEIQPYIDEVFSNSHIYQGFFLRLKLHNPPEVFQVAIKLEPLPMLMLVIKIFCSIRNQPEADYNDLYQIIWRIPKMRKPARYYLYWVLVETIYLIRKKSGKSVDVVDQDIANELIKRWLAIVYDHFK